MAKKFNALMIYQTELSNRIPCGEKVSLFSLARQCVDRTIGAMIIFGAFDLIVMEYQSQRDYWKWEEDDEDNLQKAKYVSNGYFSRAVTSILNESLVLNGMSPSTWQTNNVVFHKIADIRGDNTLFEKSPEFVAQRELYKMMDKCRTHGVHNNAHHSQQKRFQTAIELAHYGKLVDPAQAIADIANHTITTTNLQSTQPKLKEPIMANLETTAKNKLEDPKKLLEKAPLPWRINGDSVTDKFGRVVSTEELRNLALLNSLDEAGLKTELATIIDEGTGKTREVVQIVAKTKA